MLSTFAPAASANNVIMAFPKPVNCWEASSTGEEGKKAISLSENEKIIFDILKPKGELPLQELKELAGLSNKAWDKGIKNLGKLGLTKVHKTENNLLCKLVE